MLLAFVGQVVAYHYVAVHKDISNSQFSSQKLFLDNQDSDLTTRNDLLVEGAAKDQLTSEKEEDCCEVQCCENDCFCPANACAPVVFLELSLPTLESAKISEPVLPVKSKSTRFIATSLYRPPIFTS
ncbi:hypothetical protein D5018_09755 [Parashewanella curva]|uniref:CopL family metal-binding regulatory protein n=2 Tax=Parashewanella curva TaxID=2338552 RepID=A0A3L8PZ39_9GAMM|nr:hypothetical protein D5018_09755 [Parashewanella curva]